MSAYRTPFSDEEKKQIDRLIASGKSIKAVARELHIGKDRLKSFLDDNGIETERSAKIKALKEMRQQRFLTARSYSDDPLLDRLRALHADRMS